MQDRYESFSRADGAVQVDEGLRRYMLRVYNYMGAGLAVTGIAAFLTLSSGLIGAFFTVQNGAATMSGLGWLVMLAPLGFVFALSAGINRMKASTAQLVFWLYAAINGLALTPIVAMYTGESVARVFFITAATFGGMSLYGYTTKRDLSGMGSFMMMGLFGIIIAGIVNIFMQSSMMSFAISAIAVVVFVGLTAYDTQKIRDMYVENEADSSQAKRAIMGALALYLDFINLFIHLLRLMGDRR